MVRVSGTGLTDFGEYPEITSRELFGIAANEAIKNSDVSPTEIEEIFIGNFMGELTENQGHMGPILADASGVHAPATRYESACASSAAAVRQAVRLIRTGEIDVALVGGVERMNNVSTSEATAGLASAADALWEVNAGLTFPGAYALMARKYMQEYGASREDLAHVAIKNHEHALANEHAQYREKINIDDVVDAPMVCTPFGLYECSPITDGASAIILTSDEIENSSEISITGSGQGVDDMALQKRDKITETPAAEEAAAEAFEDAERTPQDIDVVEVHDCFTIAEVLALEASGFYEIGEGFKAARDGETHMDGELPVNLSGGLKAKGHPVGATGAAQIVSLTRILNGSHPRSDKVSDAQVGFAHNAGGTVASCVSHIVEVVE